jgi:hypothetical protein
MLVLTRKLGEQLVRGGTLLLFYGLPAWFKKGPRWYNPGTLRNPIGGRLCQYLNAGNLEGDQQAE